MTTESTERVTIPSEVAGRKTARMPGPTMLARLVRRPELGALSGAILIYTVFYVLAGSSGMFTPEGIINILQVSAEIGILARRSVCQDSSLNVEPDHAAEVGPQREDGPPSGMKRDRTAARTHSRQRQIGVRSATARHNV